MRKRLQGVQGLLGLLWSLLGVGIGVLLFGGQLQVHALPEYATRTGEPCATCHVNPAGGGPRTARSALWIAQGRPDQVPQLPGTAASEGAASGDGQALYGQLGCAGCHGDAGQGASGPALNLPGAGKEAEQAIRKGRGTMLAYAPDKLSDADLASIVTFVQSLATSTAKSARRRSSAAPRSGGVRMFGRPPRPTAGASTNRSCGGN